jgi:hypothetical protein
MLHLQGEKFYFKDTTMSSDESLPDDFAQAIDVESESVSASESESDEAPLSDSLAIPARQAYSFPPPTPIPLAPSSMPVLRPTQARNGGVDATYTEEEARKQNGIPTVKFTPEDIHNLKRSVTAETIKQVGQQRAQEVRKNFTRSATARAKEAHATAKAIDNSGLFDEEHSKNVHLMRHYKTTYGNKVQWKWRNTYDSSIKPHVLANEVKEFDYMLKIRDAPAQCKYFAVLIAKFVEEATLNFGIPYLQGFEKRMQVLIYGIPEYGVPPKIEDEFELLALKYYAFFARTPEEKLGWKVAQEVLGCIGTNLGALNGSSKTPQADASILKQASDL